ncbi:protein serine/threonine phosphatase 2C [Thelephora ganbajun]|uniref:Protein serine/threonine phosphatase 2C n=1 Tax=Thelephora ganbajun TaxID=370292 RepID=A0ACB6ZTT2_THEGA|nr:protein serine/threonine phosphatase 2C [Thelephora ganbajun]
MNFTVKQAFADDLGLGWAGGMADWPIDYNSYTSEDAFCEALKAKATADIIATPNGIVAHTLTLQPYTKPVSTGNEDRHAVKYWELPSGQWTFVGVFDGHSGHETSEYTAKSLPPVVKSHLERVLTGDPNAGPNAIGHAFSKAIQVFDKSFEDNLKAVIPENFESLSDEELQAVINDQATGGRVYTKVMKCMRGACSVITVIDPAKENLWIVNLGDCEAVLGERRTPGLHKASILTSIHNATISAERERIHADHPGEEEATLNNRVLGALEPTRAIGDHSFKLPAVYTEKIFLNAQPGFRAPRIVRQFTARNKTPPYVSSVPEVQHRRLDKSVTNKVIVATDGLRDLYEGRLTVTEDLIKRWVHVVMEEGDGFGGHKALSLASDGLGEDLNMKSMRLTIDLDRAWLDDTTIVVITI